MKQVAGAGRTIAKGEADFDAALLGTSFNAQDPGRRPALIVQANDDADVVAAVRQARDQGLTIGICSGGHSWAQNHIRDGGMLIDLSRLDSIAIDPAGGTATIGPGCLAGDLNAALVKHKLFFPVAHAYTVGMGGFLLQGGFGWNSRASGLACQSVIGIDVVLADGTLVHANETENPDLLWAARGSGPGFFGVVLRFHLRLQLRPKFVGMKIQVFRIRHLEAVMAWADQVGPSVAPFAEFQLVFDRKAMGIFAHGIQVLAPVLADSWREARAAVAFIDKSPIRKLASFTLPLLPVSLGMMMKGGERTLFLPNTRWTADSMWMDTPIDPLLPALRRIADTQPAAPSHALWLNWNGPATRPDMAFSLEARTYLALYGGLRGSTVANPADESWATDHMRALQEHSVGIQLADENLGRRPAPFMAPANLARLDALRLRYDPDGLFNPYMGRIA
jgi:FAD/FMN-containing dehydrogenase